MSSCDDSLEKIIQTRRSIRKYKPEAPPSSWIAAMIACAARAPSPSNSQPVRFFRISSQDVREDLRKALIAGRDALLAKIEEKGETKRIRNLVNAYFRYSVFMFDAPVIMAVGTETNISGFSNRLREADLLPRDAGGETDLDISLGLSLKGFLLKGEALGLGTCILTAPLVFLSDVESRMGVDIENVRIKCFVTVGFADETPPFIGKKAVFEIYREI